MADNSLGLRIALVESEEDMAEAFDCGKAAFVDQTHDRVWMAMTPGYDTPEGKAKAVARWVEDWKGATKDRNGDLNTFFVKASVADPETRCERVAGLAIWKQSSEKEGYGDPRPTDEKLQQYAKSIYPDDEREARFLFQVVKSLNRRVTDAVRAKANDAQPAAMILDFCAVNPFYQGQGIARKLCDYGLNEAKRRGGLEALTEASTMGRMVYAKLGFKSQENNDYRDVGLEFLDRALPSNLFMRTQPERN